MTFFNTMPALYWSDVTKASWLQRYIILHSVLYYELDTTLITDRQFDQACQQYVQLYSSLLEEEKQSTQYFYCMANFDGTTGFDLSDKLTEDDRKRIDAIITTIKYSK